MSKLPSEQPPQDTPTRLSEWLSRMMILINGALNTVNRLVITEVEAVSTVDQVPLGLDTPLQITFDSSYEGTYGGVSVDSAGTITINKSGQYTFESFLSLGRVGSPQDAYLIAHATVNGDPSDNSFAFSISSGSQIGAMHATFIFDLEAGDVIKLWITRDSIGQNDGRLRALTPSNPAIPTTKSARILVKRQLDP